jgi:hypothetical protein
MSGYNKVLALYEADSDEDSSDGGSLIMAIANGRRGSQSSDDFSLPDGLMYGDDKDDVEMHGALNPQTYNPTGLTIRGGHGLTIDDDSSDDGRSVGDDPAYQSLTIGRTDAIRMGDIDEQSIGSDDDFEPATHSNFPKNTITASDKDFDGMLSVAVSGADAPAVVNADDDADNDGENDGGGRTGRTAGQRGLGGRGNRGMTRANFQQKQQDEVVEALGRVRGSRGKGATREDVASGRVVAPKDTSAEVGTALAGVLAKAGKIGESARQGLSTEDTAQLQGAFKNATPEQRVAIQKVISDARAGKGDHAEFIARMSEKVQKAQAKGKSVEDIAKMVEREEKA